MTEPTFWNGEPATARQVSVIVADAPQFPEYWARDLIGQRRNAVEVTYGGHTFYLDDEAAELPGLPPEIAKALGESTEPRTRPSGSAWAKVTAGHGSPAYGHSELSVEPGSVIPR